MQKAVPSSIIFLFLIALVHSESCGPIDPKDVHLAFFTQNVVVTFDLTNIIEFKLVGLDSKKEIVIYAYDFLEKSYSKSVEIIATPFLLEEDKYNFLVLDYRRFIDDYQDNYIFDAVPNAIKIGKLLGKTLVDLHEKDHLDIKRITLIGFSLGAHIMGEVGRTVKKVSNNTLKIPKIVGLDPAGPAFYPLNPYVVALNKNDADFVQIIHTDTENFGIPVSTGHADFWPNGGKNQPSCEQFDKENIFKPENQCSHIRSVEYYAESILSDSSFQAIKCDSWNDFQANNCSEPQLKNHLGKDANTQLQGDFYLLTN